MEQKQRKIETVVFDMDGTLLDSLDGLMASTNAALIRCGYPPRTRGEIRAFVGNGVGKLIERALPGGLGNPDYGACLAAFKEDYKTAMFTGTRPYPGMTALAGCASGTTGGEEEPAAEEDAK